jgi:hypothetical protein
LLAFANTLGINKTSAERMLDKVISMQSRFASMMNESLLPKKLKKSFIG